MTRLALILWLALGTALAPVTILIAPQALAVQPDEVLDNPVLEGRARELSRGLRCMVCRNESIDESNAELARDMRILVRERLVEGDTDQEVIEFIVDRYGEYALLKPTTGGANWLLWAAGPLMLLLALAVGLSYLRGRETAPETGAARLNEDEKARLSKILED
ncbi:MAG: cytochrome c-type biogenesis protein [Paracoccaceae bacterium]|uniref:cytochrome c-type biogenesis protein n=1 Tax=Seohaeicola saemankumensis TaxID=481181 RepID=UPI001E631CC6|nr:cytochrome c-type biogenesis protein [Seohaeicola saemankumensis]MCD1624544.1 cytochrome c-type biogenesis protein CcmH [Seohaeicola saemankumensis]